MKTIKVKSVGVVINHQPAGSVIEVSESELEKLLELGYVEEIKKEKPKAKPSSKKASAKTKTQPKKTATKAKAKTKDGK